MVLVVDARPCRCVVSKAKACSGYDFIERCHGVNVRRERDVNNAKGGRGKRKTKFVIGRGYEPRTNTPFISLELHHAQLETASVQI